MKREAVISKNIKSVGYDEKTKVLEIEFHNEGRIYEYYNVPVGIFQGLKSSASKENYHHINIKDEYPSHQIQ